MLRQLRDELVAAKAIDPKTAHALEAGAIALDTLTHGVWEHDLDALASKCRQASKPE